MGSSSCAPRSKAILPRAGGSATRQRGRRSCCRRATRAAPTSASSNLGIRLVPDATGLELYAQELRDRHTDSILDTEFHRNRATLVANPEKIRPVLEGLQEKGYRFLASLHGVDYYPHAPRRSPTRPSRPARARRTS